MLNRTENKGTLSPVEYESLFERLEEARRRLDVVDGGVLDEDGEVEQPLGAVDLGILEIGGSRIHPSIRYSRYDPRFVYGKRLEISGGSATERVLGVQEVLGGDKLKPFQPIVYWEDLRRFPDAVVHSLVGHIEKRAGLVNV